MPLRDLLWCCPECGPSERLRPRGPAAEACSGCGAVYRRGAGASILRFRPGDSEIPECGTAEAWLSRLPAMVPPYRASERVKVREVERWEEVRRRGEYLGSTEIYGPEREGTLELNEHGLILLEPDRRRVGWEFEVLRAVQASSSALQIRARGSRPVSFRFPEASVRYWEELLRNALRDYYRTTADAEIVEFQPRITLS